MDLKRVVMGCQNIFDRYVTYADYWIQDNEYRDADTGEAPETP